MNPVILGVVRHVLSGIGAILAAKGYVGADEAEVAVGAVMALAAVGWSAWSKRAR